MKIYPKGRIYFTLPSAPEAADGWQIGDVRVSREEVERMNAEAADHERISRTLYHKRELHRLLHDGLT